MPPEHEPVFQSTELTSTPDSQPLAEDWHEVPKLAEIGSAEPMVTPRRGGRLRDAQRVDTVHRLTELGLTVAEISTLLDKDTVTIQKDRKHLQSQGTLGEIEHDKSGYFAAQLQEYARLVAIRRRHREEGEDLTEIEGQTLDFLERKLTIPFTEAFIEGIAAERLLQQSIRTQNPAHQGYAHFLEKVFKSPSAPSSVHPRVFAERVMHNYLATLADDEAANPVVDWHSLESELRGLLDDLLGTDVRLPLSNRDVIDIQAQIQVVLRQVIKPDRRTRLETILNERFLAHEAPKTLRSLANDFGITVERVRQIEAKLLRQFRHPNLGLKKYTLTVQELHEADQQEIEQLRAEIMKLTSEYSAAERIMDAARSDMHKAIDQAEGTVATLLGQNEALKGRLEVALKDSNALQAIRRILAEMPDQTMEEQHREATASGDEQGVATMQIIENLHQASRHEKSDSEPIDILMYTGVLSGYIRNMLKRANINTVGELKRKRHDLQNVIRYGWGPKRQEHVERALAQYDALKSRETRGEGEDQKETPTDPTEHVPIEVFGVLTRDTMNTVRYSATIEFLHNNNVRTIGDCRRLLEVTKKRSDKEAAPQSDPLRYTIRMTLEPALALLDGLTPQRIVQLVQALPDSHPQKNEMLRAFGVKPKE